MLVPALERWDRHWLGGTRVEYDSHEAHLHVGARARSAPA